MRILATASAGTQRLLAGECAELGLRPRRVPAHGVELELDWEGVAHALVRLRTAQRVLIYLGQFPCDGAASLYDGALSIDWQRWLEPDQTLMVAATGRLPSKARGGALRTHVFANQRIKDAICDQLRQASGARPSVDLRQADLRVVARFSGDACSLWLDPGGEALHRRGYRSEAGPAPLRETLAATVIRASGWTGEAPLGDPMCGAGTLLIEAVLAALDIAPGRDRSFAAERWRREGAALGPALQTAKARALEDAERALRSPAARRLRVWGSDLDEQALGFARGNAERAGVGGLIQWRRQDACRLPPPEPGTVLVCNPPYGERIGGDDVAALYAELGRHWRGFRGCEAHLLDGNPDFEAAFGLRWQDALALSNGDLAVTLRRYVL